MPRTRYVLITSQRTSDGGSVGKLSACLRGHRPKSLHERNRAIVDDSAFVTSIRADDDLGRLKKRGLVRDTLDVGGRGCVEVHRAQKRSELILLLLCKYTSISISHKIPLSGNNDGPK